VTPESNTTKTGVLFISSAENIGADTFVHALIMKHLDRERFDVHVAVPRPVPSRECRAYEFAASIPRLTIRPTTFLPSIWRATAAQIAAEAGRSVFAAVELARLSRYVRRQRIALIHSTDRPRDAVTCALVGRLSGARSIIHVHVRRGETNGLVRWAMHSANALVGVSGFVQESLVACGYARSKCHTVLNGIDLARWNPETSGDAVRQEFGIPRGAPVIACAARLFRWKGQDVLLRAIPAVGTEFPSLRVLIVGVDDDVGESGSFSGELRALADTLGVRERVIFTGQRSDMPAIMAACDVFALPSNEEPFGLVFAEAMAMKKPVAAIANGGTPEVVEHRLSGLLSAPGDLNGFTANLLTLLRDRDLRHRLGDYGRCTVERRFTAEHLATSVANLYDSMTTI
jgi:glycosyltransferase involved in cell wall biosynthesis